MTKTRATKAKTRGPKLTNLMLDDQQINTLLAALRFYQEQGMGEPFNRSDAIHDIATNFDAQISMDAEGIDSLCELINGA